MKKKIKNINKLKMWNKSLLAEHIKWIIAVILVEICKKVRNMKSDRGFDDLEF